MYLKHCNNIKKSYATPILSMDNESTVHRGVLDHINSILLLQTKMVSAISECTMLPLVNSKILEF